MKYEILEHTADLKIRIFGKTKEELFLNALLAMSENQKVEGYGQKNKRQIQVKSVDLSSLLIDFLNEALYLGQINKEIYDNVNFKTFINTRLEGELFGRKIKRFGEDIKAATHHNFKIEEKKDRAWEATILFDV